MKAPPSIRIEGHVSPGFEAVRAAFAENFSSRHELGGAWCVYHHGEKVVDLWGGVRNKSSGEPWQEDTMVVVHSATKGLAAMTLALAHSRGWLDYEQRVCTYWPEFAQNGKESITVRQLLAHQAGLFAFNAPVDRSVVADLDRLAAFNHRSNIKWALVVNPGTLMYLDKEHIYVRQLEVPSGNGVGTARAIAHAYSVFATGGRELGLRPQTLQALSAPAIPATQGGFFDACMLGDLRFLLGFMKPGLTVSFGSESSFGHPGSGGAMGFADPKSGIGYAYVTSQMGTRISGDPRDLALRDAVYAVIARTEVQT